MPYINEARAQKVHQRGFALDGAELNYIISYHIAAFLRFGRPGALTYPDIEAVRGATGAFDEFERRVAQPFEEHKIAVAEQEDRADPFAPLDPRAYPAVSSAEFYSD